MKKNNIKIAVLNLQSGIGITKGYWQYPLLFWKYFLPHSSKKIGEVADFINEEKISVLGLIEADAGSIRTKNLDQTAFIFNKTKLKQKIFFSTHNFNNLINHGNAVLSSFPILKSEKIRLPGRGEPRYLIKATMKINSKTMAIFLSHLSLGKKTRKMQVEKIANIIGDEKGQVIFMGDLNAFFIESNGPEQRGELSPLFKKGFKSMNKHNTYPSWNPKICIDHILFRGLKIKKAYAYSKRIFSDHLPLVAEIDLQ